ncbi:amidase [Rhizobiaceae bacterium BDR2-2]|uniref:Amidase n=1 Tax=Ectorhizobium quercum TaxID=2965071 RepID=A0AAE3MVQ5_9HYPH|nr:amidase [Ectorhizobium quercum]MCX8995818.1 amidase [Ectorhizobium quercum]
MTEDITRLSAAALSEAIHQRRLSCVAVMEAYLDRIDRLNPEINAIISLRPRADIMEEARACDRELAEGQSRGWMHGFPQAVKDLSEAKGLPCTFGSPIFKDYVSTADSIPVERARAAGAIFIGKTNTPEFGLGSHTTNPVHGPTRNPYDRAKSAGGSSGGAAAALAARLLPVADGSDMMGSLRNPAAFDNVVGFRPSFGRVPSGKGTEFFLGQLGTSGPMGRTVADAALLLATQAGYDRRDPLSLDDADMTLRGPAKTAGLTIAWFGDFGGYLPFEPGVLDVDRKALDVLADIGCQVDEIAPEFDLPKLWDAWLTLRSFAATHGLRALYDQPEKRALFNPQLSFEFAIALSRSAADIHAASVVRTSWYKYMCSLFDRYDFIIMPAAQVFPFDVTLPWPGEIAGRTMDTYHRWMEVVIGPTLAGLPVAAMPAGFGVNGLPNGVQLVGPPRGDRATLEFALAYEQAAGIETGNAFD